MPLETNPAGHDRQTDEIGAGVATFPMKLNWHIPLAQGELLKQSELVEQT